MAHLSQASEPTLASLSLMSDLSYVVAHLRARVALEIHKVVLSLRN